MNLSRIMTIGSGICLLGLLLGCPPSDNGGNGGNNGGNGGSSDPNNIAAGDISGLTLRPASTIDNVTPPTALAITRVVATGDAVPDVSGATFTDFGAPLIDSAGRVAFFAGWQSGSTSGAGLYVWRNGVLTRVIDTDESHTPDVLVDDDRITGINVRWDSGSPHLTWGAGERLLFAVHLNNSPQPNALLRWRASDGDLLLISDCPNFAESLPDATDAICEFYHPAVSDIGVAIFSQRFSFFREDGSFSLFNFGVFSTNGRVIRRWGRGVVPEQPAAARFGDPTLLTAYNGSGDRLFQAAYTNGQGTRGVYLHRDAKLYRALDNAPNRLFNGLASSATVNTGAQPFAAIALSERGHIAAQTSIAISGATRETVLLWNGSTWSELRDGAGNVATALLSGVNEAGQVAYLAGGAPYVGDAASRRHIASSLPAALTGVALTWDAFGGSLNNHGGALLRYRRTSGDTPGLLLWTGQQGLIVADVSAALDGEAYDTIFTNANVAPADADRVGTLSARPETDRPGRSGMLNDAFQFCFRAGFIGADGQADTADDRQAIFFGAPE